MRAIRGRYRRRAGLCLLRFAIFIYGRRQAFIIIKMLRNLHGAPGCVARRLRRIIIGENRDERNGDRREKLDEALSRVKEKCGLFGRARRRAHAGSRRRATGAWSRRKHVKG